MIMERLAELKAGFRSLIEAIDTTPPAGRMMMQMVGAFAEFERACCENAQGWELPMPEARGVLGAGNQNSRSSSETNS
jgi:hypothetical protein